MISLYTRILLAAVAVAAFALPRAALQSQTAERPSQSPPLADQELGRRFQVKAEELPPPYATVAVSNPPLILPYANQAPKAPEGFTVTPFATGLAHPRRLLVLPNGDVIVAEQKA